MRRPRVYLDHLASTPLAESAREAMKRALDVLGSPSSPHAEGRAAKDRLEAARTRASRAVGCRPRELVFAPSGTAASQLAVLGLARSRRDASRRVVLSAVEHPAVGDAGDRLAAEGFDVVRVPCDEHGVVDADRFLDAVGDEAAAAALVLANHEVGARQPVAEVASTLRTRGIPYFCDACLGPGRTPSSVGDLCADVVAYSAHKFGGPKGMGLLYVRRGTALTPLWVGGRQEERLVPGTEDVLGAVGSAAALEEALKAGARRADSYDRLLAHFLDDLGELNDHRVLGARTARLPGVATVELPGVEGEAAMINLDLQGIAVSTGSTCALGATEPSATLRAMGLSRTRAASTLRISVGEGVDERDVHDAAAALVDVVRRLRKLARP